MCMYVYVNSLPAISFRFAVFHPFTTRASPNGLPVGVTKDWKSDSMVMACRELAVRKPFPSSSCLYFDHTVGFELMNDSSKLYRAHSIAVLLASLH